MIDKTILYLTDNSLEEKLAGRCRDLLIFAAGDIPIVSVSQEPIDFGRNLCVGNIGRTGSAISFQVLTGLKEINTKWVFLAEHDCVYSSEHFQYTPPDDRYFWYNDNVWFLQREHPRFPEIVGMYSRIRGRRAMSQMVCDARLFESATEALFKLIADPIWASKHPRGRVGEPGSVKMEHMEKLLCRLTSHNKNDLIRLRQQLDDYVKDYEARDWKTVIPNLDIRHSSNFTGQRRGNHRRFNLEPWGTMKDVLDV